MDKNRTEPPGEDDKCDPGAERAAMADGQSSVPVSPSGGRVVGYPHGYLCFVDAVDLVLRFLGNSPKFNPYIYARRAGWMGGYRSRRKANSSTAGHPGILVPVRLRATP